MWLLVKCVVIVSVVVEYSEALPADSKSRFFDSFSIIKSLVRTPENAEFLQGDMVLDKGQIDPILGSTDIEKVGVRAKRLYKSYPITHWPKVPKKTGKYVLVPYVFDNYTEKDKVYSYSKRVLVCSVTN